MMKQELGGGGVTCLNRAHVPHSEGLDNILQHICSVAQVAAVAADKTDLICFTQSLTADDKGRRALLRTRVSLPLAR